jgi:hypothetical protein
MNGPLSERSAATNRRAVSTSPEEHNQASAALRAMCWISPVGFG